METVLLVGGSGFLGLHLIKEFWACSPRPKIHVFDIRPLPPVPREFYEFDPEQIVVHIGDITSEQDVSEAIRKANPDVIVHSASPMHDSTPQMQRKVNVTGTRNLIACAKKLKVKSLVYTSSTGVLFNGSDVYCADEEFPFPPTDMDEYNKTKTTAEVYVLESNSEELKTVALRPAGLFGPGDRQMIPQLRKMGREGKYKIQLGDNQNLFDITYVGNVAYGHVLAAKHISDPKSANKVAGQVFHITNDAPIYFWSFGKMIWKCDGYFCENPTVIPKPIGVFLGYAAQAYCWLTGKEPTLTPYRVRTTTATRYFDITKAKSVLGYTAKTDLESAVTVTLSFMDKYDY